MIDPKELRIGNYLNDFLGRHGKLLEFSLKRAKMKMEFSTLKCDLQDLHRIELNEEWLLKFGFVKIPESKNDYLFATLNLRFEKGVFFVYKHIAETFGFLGSVKYVHQLQNLFFALTGSEFPIPDLIKSLETQE